METKSGIYDGILKEREIYPALPYVFQNVETAGREDTLFVLMSEGVPFSHKEDLAAACCKWIITNDRPAIQAFLEKNPIRLFFIELRERLRVLIEQQFVTIQDLHKLGVELARTSSDPEAVKLGIILMGFYPHDLTMHMFKILGYHSEFTLYVAESVNHAHFKQNEFLFDLLQHTVGYGKLAALFLIKPVTELQQKWIIKHGIKSNNLSNVYVNVSLQKTDIRHYLFNTDITKENYTDFMYALAYREPIEEKSLTDSLLAFMAKMVAEKEFAQSFVDGAGLVMIWLQIIDSWKQDYLLLDEKQNEDEPLSEYWDWRFKQYEALIRDIEVFLNKPKWHHITTKEMMNPTETDYLIVNVLQFLEMTPDFSSFSAMLLRNPLGLNILDIFLVHQPETYFDDVCRYLDQLLSEKLFQIPLQFNENENPGSNDLLKVNIWLDSLFKNMLEKNYFDEEWCVKALEYYHPKIRKMSLQVLIKNVDFWEDDEEVFDALEMLADEEENRKNRRLLHSLLHEGMEEEKTKQYASVPNPVTTPAITDKKLMDTYVAGMRHRDLTMVDSIVKKGKILQLVREKDNGEDRFAIAITVENGYMIGYIPRGDNRVLATLLDNGEILYARFEAEDVDEKDAIISIMLRKKNETHPEMKIPIKDNVLPFPKKNR